MGWVKKKKKKGAEEGKEKKEGGEKTSRPQSKRKRIRVMRKKVAACVCYRGSSALVFTA